jgi:hypothetical protein
MEMHNIEERGKRYDAQRVELWRVVPLGFPSLSSFRKENKNG